LKEWNRSAVDAVTSLEGRPEPATEIVCKKDKFTKAERSEPAEDRRLAPTYLVAAK
jgi:hypothetical protein